MCIAFPNGNKLGLFCTSYHMRVALRCVVVRGDWPFKVHPVFFHEVRGLKRGSKLGALLWEVGRDGWLLAAPVCWPPLSAMLCRAIVHDDIPRQWIPCGFRIPTRKSVCAPKRQPILPTVI